MAAAHAATAAPLKQEQPEQQQPPTKAVITELGSKNDSKAASHGNSEGNSSKIKIIYDVLNSNRRL